MDFLKILKSLEEFVYEALTWLVLLPRTLWRILLSPRRMTAYASDQLASDGENRFSAAISPPLLLILCVLLSHAVDLAIRDPVSTAETDLGAVVLSSEQNLLLYRTAAFGIWSLVGAVYLLVRMRMPVDRETLRGPFYEQCYLVAPFALSVSLALTLMTVDQPWALLVATGLSLVATLWFWLVQAAWFRARASLSLWRSLVAAGLVVVLGSAVNAGVGRVLTDAPVPAAESAADVEVPTTGPKPCPGDCR